MKKPFVAILMGSQSDLHTMKAGIDLLNRLNIDYEVNILSAHRTPVETANYVEKADDRGCQVFIAAAGLAAHLAGAVAAHTIKPVIGVPMEAGGLNGLDALLSTVQMPPGVPVACVAIGKAGAMNAAILSAQIMALHDPKITDQLIGMRQEKRQLLVKQNQEISHHLANE